MYQKGKGLPIGNMTSQLLAIYFLNDLDHYIKKQLHCKYYIRYMDDFIIFSHDKERLKEIKNIVSEKLIDFKLELNKKTNIYDISNSYEIGYTLKNEPFFFDIEDYDLIKNYCWRLRSDGYLDAKIPRTDNRILMHNLIMNHRYIDHINGIRHDNRKINLRLSDNQYGFNTYNQMNKRVQSNNKSGCPGVCWHSRDKIWEVHISVDNKLLYLGRYSSYEDAVCARKRSEEKIFKDWSYDNSQKIGRNTNVIV